MAKKKTHEVYELQLNDVNKNLKLLSKYIGNHDKVKVECLVCGYKFESDAASLLQGHGCRICGIEKMKDLQRKTHKKFLIELREVQPTLTVLTKYINNTTEVQVRCNECENVYFATPKNLLRNYKCKQCFLKRQHKSPDKYAQELYNKNKNIKINSKYTKSKNKIDVECMICGYKWTPFAGNFLHNGARCPKCAGNVPMTTNEFKTSINKMNQDIIVLGVYKNANMHITCKCKVCNNEWEAIPYYLLHNDAKCPNCSLKDASLKRRKTHDEFLKELEMLVDDVELVTEYITVKDDITCRCKLCKTIWITKPEYLLRNSTNCPNCQKRYSLLETTIQKYLNDNNVNYEIHKTFNSLYGVNGGKLSYDFYIIKNNEKILIEAQGKQHEQPLDFFGGEEQFKIQQEHDKRKKQYALDNNIKLLEIWYWDFDNIEEILHKELNL